MLLFKLMKRGPRLYFFSGRLLLGAILLIVILALAPPALGQGAFPGPGNGCRWATRGGPLGTCIANPSGCTSGFTPPDCGKFSGKNTPTNRSRCEAAKCVFNPPKPQQPSQPSGGCTQAESYKDGYAKGYYNPYNPNDTGKKTERPYNPNDTGNKNARNFGGPNQVVPGCKSNATNWDYEHGQPIGNVKLKLQDGKCVYDLNFNKPSLDNCPQWAGGGTTSGAGTTSGGGTTPGITVSIPNPLKFGTLAELLNAMAKFLFNISFPIVTIMVLYGGLQILTAAGRVEQINAGKRTLLWAVIGFLAILVAGGISKLIASILGA